MNEIKKKTIVIKQCIHLRTFTYPLYLTRTPSALHRTALEYGTNSCARNLHVLYTTEREFNGDVLR